MKSLATLLALAALAFAQERVVLKGRLVDADGQPVAGADVATMWIKGRPDRAVQTDDAGKFVLEADYYGRGTVAILAKDRERKRGVVSRFSRASFGKARELTVEPLIEVKGRLNCKRLGGRIAWTNAYAYVQPGMARVAQFDSRESEFRFLLPPGDYRFNFYGTDEVKGINDDKFLDGEEKVIDYGTIELEPTPLALMLGGPAPRIHVTDARGVKKEVQLADFKGKYVLVEFWGFW